MQNFCVSSILYMWDSRRKQCKKKKSFKAALGLQQNWEVGTKISCTLLAPPPSTCTAQPPLFSHSLEWSFFKNPRMILHGHHNYPKSIVYFRVHSWCCTIHGFCQIIQCYWPTFTVSYKIVSLPWKTSVLHLFIPPSSQPLATADLFTVSTAGPFPVSQSWNHTLCSLFRWASSAKYLHLGLLVSFHGLTAAFFLHQVMYNCLQTHGSFIHSSWRTDILVASTFSQLCTKLL